MTSRVFMISVMINRQGNLQIQYYSTYTFFYPASQTMILLYRMKRLFSFSFQFQKEHGVDGKARYDPFTDIRKGTTQRSAKWAAIAEALVAVKDIDVRFRVDKRAVRDRQDHHKEITKTKTQCNEMYSTLNALRVPHKPLCIDSQIVSS